MADDFHATALGRGWKPDAWGWHDHLTAHPYTGEPGRVDLTATRAGVIRLWVAMPERTFCLLPLVHPDHLPAEFRSRVKDPNQGVWISPSERVAVKQLLFEREIARERAEYEAAEAERRAKRRNAKAPMPADHAGQATLDV